MSSSSTATTEREYAAHAIEAGFVADDEIRLIVSSSLPAGSEGFGACDTDTISIEDRGFDGKYRRVLTIGPHTARQLAAILDLLAVRMTKPERVEAARQAVGRDERRRMGIVGKPSDAEEPGAVD